MPLGVCEAAEGRFWFPELSLSREPREPEYLLVARGVAPRRWPLQPPGGRGFESAEPFELLIGARKSWPTAVQRPRVNFPHALCDRVSV
jgi:hypothetical protein